MVQTNEGVGKITKAMSKSKVQRTFFRNGQLRSETWLLDGQFHGPTRAWHRNGQLATGEFYDHGLAHGLGQRWNEAGKLLGSFRMKHGTGIRRDWFENGKLSSESSRVNGFFTGRMRHWIMDGTLSSECYLIENRDVSRQKYLAAARKNPAYLPAPADKLRVSRAANLDKRQFALHIQWLLSLENQCEAREWLKAGAAKRSLGLLNFKQAQQLVKKIYATGAHQIIVVNIYHGKSGKQFSDQLVIKMPGELRARRRIHKLLGDFPAKIRGAAVPEPEDDAEYAYASFE